MLFVIDLDLLQVIKAATDKSPVVSVEGKRGDDTPFEVVYVRNGVAEELAASTVLTFGAKPIGKYDSAAVVLNSDFALSGAGTTAKYLASPSFNTEGLNALFLIDADDSNDVPFVDLMAEFTWQVGAGAPSSTKTFTFRVHNDVIRDESDPTPIPTPIGDTAPVNAVAASVTIDPSGADNAIAYTAVEPGLAGNSITIQYAPPAGFDVTVDVTGSDITVTPATAFQASDSARNWQSVASSADGTKLVAAVDGGQIYTSTDSGGTWTARDSSRDWRSVASSADGTKLVAAVDADQIYTSTDSGLTWTARDSSRYWRAVASSADGTKLVAAVYGGQIYTSTDSGSTWTARDSSRDWRSVASSADGTKLVAVVDGGQIYTSTDSGLTWTARDSARLWQSVASSADGTKLVAVVNSGQIYTSTDSGLTWTARDSTRDWCFVASSADGTKLVAAVDADQIYTSTDSGVTWTARDYSRFWRSVASSADGTKLVAAVDGDNLLVTETVPCFAADVIVAINGDIAASALVTAAAAGDVTGVITDVAATNLTGGNDATSTPPYLRVAGGLLYIQEAGTWKETNLYDLGTAP